MPAQHTELFVGFGGVPLKNSRVPPGGAVRHEVRDAIGKMAARGALRQHQPATRLHSQLDHGAASLATKRDGRVQVMINPQDAAARSIADGDVVELFNARGAMLAAARVTPDVMPRVLRMATWAWTDPTLDGADPHGNPNILTADRPASGFSQGRAALICLVELRRCDAPHPTTAQQPPPLASAPRAL